jgi:hypothetical protein
VSYLPAFVFSGYDAEFHEDYQKHTNPLNCRVNSSDISGYHADFTKDNALSEKAGVRHGVCG